MRTRDVIEGLLYVNGNNENVKKCLELCHLNKWESEPHLELFFLDKFKFPTFLVIIDKLMHIYIIGEKDKARTYNVLKIDGFNAQHTLLTKSEIRTAIKEDSETDEELYLPDAMIKRIIYLQSELDNYDVVIFNRHDLKKLWTTGEWSIGVDIYSAKNSRYTLHPYNILQNMLSELDD